MKEKAPGPPKTLTSIARKVMATVHRGSDEPATSSIASATPEAVGDEPLRSAAAEASRLDEITPVRESEDAWLESQEWNPSPGFTLERVLFNNKSEKVTSL